MSSVVARFFLPAPALCVGFLLRPFFSPPCVASEGSSLFTERLASRLGGVEGACCALHLGAAPRGVAPRAITHTY
eukprot:11207953-Lingulodinium_polyedra.AAC.1